MKKSLYEIIKYFFFGILSTILNYILFIVFLRIGIYYVISNIIAYALAVILSFGFNIKYVFKSQNQSRIYKLLKYIVIRIVLLTTDSLLLVFLVESIKMSIEWAKLAVFFILLVVNYLISKHWIFK